MGTGSDPPTTSTTTTTVPDTSSVTTPTTAPPTDDESYESVADAAVAVAAAAAETDEEEESPTTYQYIPTVGGYAWTDWATPTIPGSRSTESRDLPGEEDFDEFWNRTTLPSERSQLQPLYSAGYPLYTLNQMSTVQLAALEIQLYQAGYTREPQGATSRWSLLEGFTSLVTEADFGRNTWEDQLTYALDNAPIKEEEVKKSWRQLNPFIAPVEAIPDYASLSQRIKSTVREQLRRDPTSSEMQLLSTYLKGQYKNAYQSNELQTARNEWEAMARGQETGESQSAGSVSIVDPVSRFNEKFDERFGGEIDHRRRVEQTASNTKGLFSSLDTMSRMI